MAQVQTHLTVLVLMIIAAFKIDDADLQSPIPTQLPFSTSETLDTRAKP